jgi:hypothetical protein
MENLLVSMKASFARTMQWIIPVCLAALAGCVQQYPISYYASPGDTVVLGLGGIQRNSNGANNLIGSDLAITLTNNSTHAVTTLTNPGLFKAFPDYSSKMNYESIIGILPTVSYDGGWFAYVTLPSSGLTAGAYTIGITSPTNKLINTKWCFNPGLCEGDLTNIPLQIVNNNTSSASNSYASQFTYYPPTNYRLDVSPNQAPDSAGYSAVGGLQLVVTFAYANYNASLPVMAVPYSHNPSISLSQNVIDNGNGTKSLVVLLSAPQGFVTTANRTPLTPALSDLSLSLLFFPNDGVTVNPSTDFQIDQNRSHYYDTSGNVITQLHPSVNSL